MIPKKPGWDLIQDLIRGVRRFSEKIMLRQGMIPKSVQRLSEKDHAQTRC
jgi:hypothetical protein